MFYVLIGPLDADVNRNTAPSDQPGHEQDGDQMNHLAAAVGTGRPSGFGRGARRLSMSMPAKKQQASSKLANAHEAKPGADNLPEASEIGSPSSEISPDFSANWKKSSVHFGAAILQSITPKSLTRSLSTAGYRNWRPLVIVGAVVAAASFVIVFTFYLLYPRKNVIEYCDSVDCRLAVEDLKSLVNYQVSPCDNFHMHVCGRAGDNTFGGANLTTKALDDLLPLADAPLAEAIAKDTDILAATDVETVLRHVIRLSLRRGISTLFRASVITYLGSPALYMSRGKSLNEKLDKRTDGVSLQEVVARLFDGTFANARKVGQLDASNTVLRLLKFDETLRPQSGYASDEQFAGASKPEFMRQYVGGSDWLGFVNGLLPVESQLKETSLVVVSESEAIKKPVDELRKGIGLGVIYIVLHIAMEVGRFYSVPLSQVTKTCLQVAQEVLPPLFSNVFNNLTASSTSDTSRAGAIFFRVREVFLKHPLKLGLSEEDRKSVVSFLININLHVHGTTPGIWPNGSGWQPREATDSAAATFPQIHGTLKDREALRRLSDPPLFEQVTFRRDFLASNVAYSLLLNEIFLPASLRRIPVLYSGEVPTEFDMGTVGILMAMQMFHASEQSESGAQEWFDQNIGAFGHCFDTLPPNQLHQLFARTYSLRVVHRALSDHYEGYRYANNFRAVWREAQRTFFRRFCLLSCGDSRGNNGTTESQLDCLVPVLSMPEFHEAFECTGNDAVATGKCASLS
ncbi:hypothetical protein HPB49_015047 [Dermacentor silvarum]|uniref:Uncharacterized protein n=1 Tax=Dermacentor silvarum TaxID=543639 RepID=A0ACB8DQC3_DERSI|nr:hypothetical protein HPB49_015047 [Dermacentor silvarum]